jgi:hypothetical protein
MCPNCGRRLCKGEAGTKVEIVCPKCGEVAVVCIKDEDLLISHRPFGQENLLKKQA